MVNRADRRRKGILTAAALLLCVSVAGGSVSVLQAEEWTADTEGVGIWGTGLTVVSDGPGYYMLPEGWI